MIAYPIRYLPLVILVGVAILAVEEHGWGVLIIPALIAIPLMVGGFLYLTRGIGGTEIPRDENGNIVPLTEREQYEIHGIYPYGWTRSGSTGTPQWDGGGKWIKS